MKNATQLHEPGIVEFLRAKGCESVRVDSGRVCARRRSPAGTSYPLTVELFEDDAPGPSRQRYRARAARRHGLPLSAHYGATPTEALERLEWHLLDAFELPMPSQRFGGLV